MSALDDADASLASGTPLLAVMEAFAFVSVER